MSARLRTGLFLLSGTALGGLLVWGLSGLSAFGDYHGEYGRVLNQFGVEERHSTNVVAAVVFDYRGLDTLAEELILFASVVGVALLLREAREERAHPPEPTRSDALRAVGLGAIGLVVLLALYVVAHGYLTPGGGFQGGVVAAAGAVLLYLAAEYRVYRRATPTALVEAAEGSGAAAYIAVGLIALASGDAFLENFVGLGSSGTLLSSGTISLLNWAAALEVAAATVLLFHEFLEEIAEEAA
jgi:multicomponent Na+:H+ antiporter subunit B